jgi:aminodeoxychorismate synthase component I
LSYELNQWIERLPSPTFTAMVVPELLMLGMRMVLVVDHAHDQSWCVSVVDPHQPPDRAMREARERLEAFDDLVEAHASSEPTSPCSGRDHPGRVESLMTQAQFEAMVRTAQEYIKAGDIFQANLSQGFTAPWRGSPWSLYLALRQINPSPFACFVQCPALTIVSCSPERLVRVHHGSAEARPIAGTRPRGTSPEEDLLNSLELLLSDKERAEHIMLVDLARNDLGRVCQVGTVTVDELMGLEDYSHVVHIVSNVRGLLRRGVDAVDVIRAMFPGGTITGCPKIRCMEIIHELEPAARGVYTGSLGYVGFDGSVDLNILIRTMVIQRSRVWLHVGAGIVADSQPEREYRETLDKAGALFKALQMVATTRIAHDEVCR